MKWEFKLDPGAVRDLRAIGPSVAREIRAFLDKRIPGATDARQFGKPLRGATLLQGNDDWGGTPALVDTAARVGAFPIANLTSRDAALLVTLAAGSYTAQVSGVFGTTGVALVEISEVP